MNIIAKMKAESNMIENEMSIKKRIIISITKGIPNNFFTSLPIFPSFTLGFVT